MRPLRASARRRRRRRCRLPPADASPARKARPPLPTGARSPETCRASRAGAADRPRPTCRATARARRSRREAASISSPSRVSPSRLTSTRKSSSASMPRTRRAMPIRPSPRRAGRLGRFMRQVAGMRMTRPARSIASTSLQEAHRVLRRPAQGMKDFAGVDDRPSARRRSRWPAHRSQELQELSFVAGAGVFAQRLAERQMAQGAVAPTRPDV